MITNNLQEFCHALTKDRPIIAIDYGLKKIGIAISNQEHTVAMPFKTLSQLDEAQKIYEILKLIKQYSIGAIVIGLPVNMDGHIGEQVKIVQNFTNKLTKIISLPIYFQDERLTSKAASNLLKSLGVKRKDRDAKDDQVAASMLLETILNSLAKL